MTNGVDPLSQSIERLAEFVVECGQSAIPAEVEHFGRLLLLDSVGAMVGGTRYPAVRAMRVLLEGPRLSESDLPFGPLVTLGSAATWLDADSGGSFHPEGHRLPPVPTAHPAPHVLPVILHGAANGIDDDLLVKAFILATEVGMRFGTATSLRPGMHPHGIHGPVATAAAASMLRGHSASLTAAAMTHAIATPLAARLRVPMAGGTVRNAWTGLGAYYGAKAAAEAGQRKRLDAGTAARVLSTVVTPDVRLELLTDDLKSRWAMLDSYVKPYACARWIHPILDATRSALADRAGRPDVDAIQRIDVETFAFAASLSGIGLRSDLHARFSLPVCIAAVILDRELHAQSFLPDGLSRPEIRTLAELVHVREDPGFTAALPRERPSTVTITWHGGRQTSHHVRNSRGNPGDRLTLQEISAKFRSNVDTVLPPQLTERCIATLANRDSSERPRRVLADVAAQPGVS